ILGLLVFGAVLSFQNCSGFEAKNFFSSESSSVILGANQCWHPDLNQVVEDGTPYTFYTQGMGSESECAAAKQVATCDGGLQSFDGLPSQRFPSCSILLVPPVSGGDLNNSLKITNVSGKNVTNYPLQIGRAFMK